MLGPHMTGRFPVAAFITLRSWRLSARRRSSGTAARNFATLTLVGLVLLSAMPELLPGTSDLNPRKHENTKSRNQQKNEGKRQKTAGNSGKTAIINKSARSSFGIT